MLQKCLSNTLISVVVNQNIEKKEKISTQKHSYISMLFVEVRITSKLCEYFRSIEFPA